MINTILLILFFLVIGWLVFGFIEMQYKEYKSKKYREDIEKVYHRHDSLKTKIMESHKGYITNYASGINLTDDIVKKDLELLIGSDKWYPKAENVKEVICQSVELVLPIYEKAYEEKRNFTKQEEESIFCNILGICATEVYKVKEKILEIYTIDENLLDKQTLYKYVADFINEERSEFDSEKKTIRTGVGNGIVEINVAEQRAFAIASEIAMNNNFKIEDVYK